MNFLLPLLQPALTSTCLFSHSSSLTLSPSCPHLHGVNHPSTRSTLHSSIMAPNILFFIILFLHHPNSIRSSVKPRNTSYSAFQPPPHSNFLHLWPQVRQSLPLQPPSQSQCCLCSTPHCLIPIHWLICSAYLLSAIFLYPSDQNSGWHIVGAKYLFTNNSFNISVK